MLFKSQLKLTFLLRFFLLKQFYKSTSLIFNKKLRTRSEQAEADILQKLRTPA